jgi:hypothetical protein
MVACPLQETDAAEYTRRGPGTDELIAEPGFIPRGLVSPDTPVVPQNDVNGKGEKARRCPGSVTKYKSFIYNFLGFFTGLFPPAPPPPIAR